jgi:EAL domain-containing protein (putative c-di-GMP-specific phosphodiesterase class I)
VIAEGIETEESASELRTIRCGLGQGNFFSRARPGDLVEHEVLSQFGPSLAIAGSAIPASERARIK